MITEYNISCLVYIYISMYISEEVEFEQIHMT